MSQTLTPPTPLPEARAQIPLATEHTSRGVASRAPRSDPTDHDGRDPTTRPLHDEHPRSDP